jgi:hypothetical protein
MTLTIGIPAANLQIDFTAIWVIRRFRAVPGWIALRLRCARIQHPFGKRPRARSFGLRLAAGGRKPPLAKTMSPTPRTAPLDQPAVVTYAGLTWNPCRPHRCAVEPADRRGRLDRRAASRHPHAAREETQADPIPGYRLLCPGPLARLGPDAGGHDGGDGAIRLRSGEGGSPRRAWHRCARQFGSRTAGDARTRPGTGGMAVSALGVLLLDNHELSVAVSAAAGPLGHGRDPAVSERTDA